MAELLHVWMGQSSHACCPNAALHPHASGNAPLYCPCHEQETFGAMAKTEKIAYILEQVRLCLDRKDFVRAQESCCGAFAGMRCCPASSC